ncbi:ACT domain-containing protein ACR9 [Diospyros lotus]|uniref:ACT domain-containing protein ACR9 n=1 Tax=Diospyros lotus TaxID=55363 RepID=UPI0022562621|nr:ACT domain-containing protein ACR9 [Diospyros lotus]
MGIAWDDVVLIQLGKSPGEPSVITVNCPDKAGLGCDLCGIVVEFGLSITKGDFCTDGSWCYVVLWTVPQPSTLTVDWESLKSRLLSVCPSCSISFYFNQQYNSSLPPPLYMLKVFCVDRKGLLHDVTKALCQLELLIQRVKVMTTPDGKVLDLFFIIDSMDLLHTKKRREGTCEQLSAILGECCISCELELAGPEYESQQGFSSLQEAVAEELFSSELSTKEACSQALSPEMKKVKTANITIDNFMSPAHTLLQIQCVDQKNLVYDILRTSKDCDIQIAYGRISPSSGGSRTVDLFIQKTDGKKIVEPDHQNSLCSRLKEEMLHPLRVTIANRGPDIELLVANPVELSGKGRPRVFYDVTFALKMLGICVFSAEIGRHSTSNREWEVYRFLLDDSPEFPLASSQARNKIVDRVRRTLMGW